MRVLILRILLATMVLLNSIPLYASMLDFSSLDKVTTSAMPCHQNKKNNSDCPHCQAHHCTDLNCAFHLSPLLLTQSVLFITPSIKPFFYPFSLSILPQKFLTEIERPPRLI